jgi:cytidylate kinase
MEKIIIALDGNSACGKSTLAKEIAKELNYIYIDSGAMYRAVTYYFIKENIIDSNNIIDNNWIDYIDDINISFNNKNGQQQIYLNGKIVEDKIRSIEVSNRVSYVSKLKLVRSKLVSIQQDIGKSRGIVMDGRDIGTVVFPDAEIKFWISANINVRADRRHLEFIKKVSTISYEEVLNNLKIRDFEDENREESPSKKAIDAIIIDNSNLSKQETLIKVMKIINKELSSK